MRTLLLLAAPLALALGCASPTGRPEPARPRVRSPLSRALPPDLASQHVALGGELALTDLSELYPPPTPAADWSPPLVRLIEVVVAESGAARVGQVSEQVPWRGFLLPDTVPAPPAGVCGVPALRLKVLLWGEDGRPARAFEVGTRVVVKVGDEIYPSWDQLQGTLERLSPSLPPEAEIVVDGRPAAPARFVLAPLALALATQHPVILATREEPRDDPARAALSAALRERVADLEARSLRPLPAALRIVADARAPWESLEAVLEAARSARLLRVSFVVLARGERVELQPVRQDAAGRTLGIQPPTPAHQIQKPLILLEDREDRED